jgi:hypothetical protein
MVTLPDSAAVSRELPALGGLIFSLVDLVFIVDQ